MAEVKDKLVTVESLNVLHEHNESTYMKGSLNVEDNTTVEDVYADLRSNLCNPNLLINGDFKIWQRGESFTGTNTQQYTADRWWMWTNATVTKSSNGLLFGGGVTAKICQSLEDNLKVGETYTLSAKINGTISNMVFTAGTAKESGKLGYDVYYDYDRVYLTLSDGDLVEWVKLEKGSMATIFSPRPYAEEMLLCKRYYRQMGFLNMLISSNADGSTLVYSHPNTIPFRAVPTIIPSSITAHTRISGSTVKNQTINNFQIINHTDVLCFQMTASNTVAASGVGWLYDLSGQLEFDAEIY